MLYIYFNKILEFGSAERNRQSAAASRDRKKKHMKELEERVKKSDDEKKVLLMEFESEKRRWQERERLLEAEICRLRNELSVRQPMGQAMGKSIGQVGGSSSSTVAAHAMAMHRLTNNQNTNVGYK